MAKHFIAVLGTGFYLPCTYFIGDQTCDTKFVQEAVLKLTCGEMKLGDRITICLTQEARSLNWEDRAYSQREIENKKGMPGGRYQGLHPVLKDCLQEFPGVVIETKDIATGKDSREIARMFSDIYDVIGENEEIYFDITHGLRNIPMLVMTILEYARVTKNVSVGGIYYGAFEVGVKDEETNKKKVPLYDLTFYHTILSWSNAANSFIQYGHADEIKALVNGNYRLTVESAKNGQEARELSGNLNNVARGLHNFVSSVETGRGNAAYDKGIRNYYEDYVHQQQMITGHLQETYYPFRELLDKIDRKMVKFQSAKTNLQIGMAAVDWCIENHMVQQGYTALDETLKTFLCEKIGVPQDKEFWREKVVKRLCTCLYRVYDKSREVLDTGLTEWKEGLEAVNPEQQQVVLAKGEELFELLIGNEEHRKLIPLMNNIATKRNDISHFGFTVNTSTAKALKQDLEKMAGRFKEIQKQWDIEKTQEE